MRTHDELEKVGDDASQAASGCGKTQAVNQNRVVLKDYSEKRKPLMVGHGFMEEQEHFYRGCAGYSDTVSDSFQTKVMPTRAE
jgi:hypothetical protein